MRRLWLGMTLGIVAGMLLTGTALAYSGDGKIEAFVELLKQMVNAFEVLLATM